MLIQKINAPDPLLKLYVAIDEDLIVLHPPLQAKQFPYDPWGGMPSLSAAAVLTILVRGPGGGSRTRPRCIFMCRPLIGRTFRHWGRTDGMDPAFAARVTGQKNKAHQRREDPVCTLRRYTTWKVT